MKTILIFGGFGFIGSNVIDYIDKVLCDDYRVIVVDKYKEHPAGEKFKSIIKTYSGDLMDASLIKRVFSENRIDVVVHSFSATIPSKNSEIEKEIDGNLYPTITILEEMRKNDVKDIVFISSGGAIYGDSDAKKHKENEDVFPVSFYGIFKLTIEKVLMQHATLWEFRPLIIRLSNPYGKYHYSKVQGLCNVALKTAIDGSNFTIWGDGSARKDYIYIDDFIEILFILLSKRVHSEVINVASGQVKSVNDVMNEVKRLVPSFNWKYTHASIFDVNHFELDNSKLFSIIGPYTFTPFEEGIKKTFDWIVSK